MIDFKDIHAAEDLRAGTKLLMGLPGREPAVIATVVRLTKTQIVLRRADRLTDAHYERRTGCEVGHHAIGLRIKGIGTPEECLQIEQKDAERRRRTEDDLRIREETNQRRAKLAGLFPDGYAAQISADTDHTGKWILTLEGLNELDIHELAEFMNSSEFRFRT